MTNHFRFFILVAAAVFLLQWDFVHAEDGPRPPQQVLKEYQDWIEKIREHSKFIQKHIDESDARRAEISRELVKVLDGMADQGVSMIRAMKERDLEAFNRAQKLCNQLNEKRVKLSAQLDLPQKEGPQNHVSEKSKKAEDPLPVSIRTGRDLQRWLDAPGRSDTMAEKK